MSLWQLGFIVNAGFQLWRGAVVDAVVFTSAAVLMGASPLLLRSPGHPLPRLPRRATGPVLAVLTIYFCLTPLQQQPNRVVIAAIGPLALWQAWTLPTGKDSRSVRDKSENAVQRARNLSALRRSRVAWSAWFIALCGWEALAYALSRAAKDELANPTATVLIEPSLQSGVGRGVFALMWVGWGLAWLFTGRLNER